MTSACSAMLWSARSKAGPVAIPPKTGELHGPRRTADVISASLRADRRSAWRSRSTSYHSRRQAKQTDALFGLDIALGADQEAAARILRRRHPIHLSHPSMHRPKINA